MIRTFAAFAALSLMAFAGAASAQTYAPSWGQPVYLDAWGRPVGGTPLSEVQTRSYPETGRWADGYHERPYVYVPGRAPSYGYGRGYGSRYRQRGYGDRYATGYRSERRPYQGYREDWGYNDDRARPGRQGYVDRRGYRDGPDVYLYDR